MQTNVIEQLLDEAARYNEARVLTIPGRAALRAPTTSAPAGSTCTDCGTPMHWDAQQGEYVALGSCPARSDAEYRLPHRAPETRDYSEQAICALCGYQDHPEAPHTPHRRVRDGLVETEYLCGMCLQAQYGEPYEDEGGEW